MVPKTEPFVVLWITSKMKVKATLIEAEFDVFGCGLLLK